VKVHEQQRMTGLSTGQLMIASKKGSHLLHEPTNDERDTKKRLD
jgi:hypothetical protein